MMLERLRNSGTIRPLDDHFARLMLELARDGQGAENFGVRPAGRESGLPRPGPDSRTEEDNRLALAAALASRRTADGHVCLDLHEPMEPGDLKAPSPEEWIEQLRGSPVVGRPGEFRPLVLDDAGRLYLYRYWNYEKRIADAALERSAEIDPAIDKPLLRDGLERLFPRDPAITIDWQRVGAAVAVLRRFCILSGGPGTGKTTTVVRILALLLEQHRQPGRPFRIALAAPTGKAAARLQETIRRAREGLAVSPEIRAAIPDRAQTIHRLLGANPATGRFRHHRDNPLPVDLLVVDESSMVDIALAAKLVDALRPETRLILLGDRDQLASVEAGAVLGDLCVGSEGFTATFADLLEGVTGEQPIDLVLPRGNRDAISRRDGISCHEDLAGPQSRLGDAVVMLRHSYRFGGGIGRLAAAVNAGNGAEVMRLLQSPSPSGRGVGVRVTEPEFGMGPQKRIGTQLDLLRSIDENIEHLHRSESSSGTAALTPPPLPEGEGQEGAFLLPPDTNLPAHAAQGYVEYLQAVGRGEPPERVFPLYEKFRVLCALREGEYGVEGLNAAIERLLHNRGLIDRHSRFHAGRPVLVTRNDPALHLANGDVGLILADGEGRLAAWFPTPDGALRPLAPARLPPHETAWALTVHKSQGSEFERVLLVLPPADIPLLTRELIYTGITRARRLCELAVDGALLPRIVGRTVRRSSGLPERLVRG